jgi:hypothetical protein
LRQLLQDKIGLANHLKSSNDEKIGLTKTSENFTVQLARPRATRRKPGAPFQNPV